MGGLTVRPLAALTPPPAPPHPFCAQMDTDGRLRRVLRHVVPCAAATTRSPASPTRSADGVEFVIGPVYRASDESKPGPGVPRGSVR